MKCKTKADLYREYARVLEMVAAEGNRISTYSCLKYYGASCISEMSFNGAVDEYDFALAIVEGKPVFEGDVLYYQYGGHTLSISINSENIYNWLTFSWTPPKKRTFTLKGEYLPSPTLEGKFKIVLSYHWDTYEQAEQVEQALNKLLGGE